MKARHAAPPARQRTNAAKDGPGWLPDCVRRPCGLLFDHMDQQDTRARHSIYSGRAS